MQNFIRPELRVDWAAVADGGMRLEISAQIDRVGHQLFTVLADEKDESLWVQIYVGDTAVQIPAALLRQVLDKAVDGVHSERCYGRNVPIIPEN